MKNRDLNFSIKILCFAALVIASYFFIDKFQYIAIFPIVMCIYDGINIIVRVEKANGLKIAAALASILVFVLIIHILVAYGISNPVPVLIFFMITNLFFIYNLIAYLYYKYRRLNLVMLIVMWILCDLIPVMFIFVLSAGLSSY